MPGLNYICTWMYAETEADKGTYPQLGMDSTTQGAQAVYWRCAIVFFETVRRALQGDESFRLVLFTNLARLPTVDGVDLNAYFSQIGVQVVSLQYTWKPAGSRRSWFNQYYVFDIFSYLAATLNSDDAVVLADSDCVFVRDPLRLFDVVRRDGVLLITVDVTVPEDQEINGLSRTGAIDVYERLGSQRPTASPPYFGGECYGMTKRVIEAAMEMARSVKPANDALAARGERYLSDEAHFFSFVLWRLGFSRARTAICSSGASGRRGRRTRLRPKIWILTLWHLPSEKRIGFQKVYDRLHALAAIMVGAQNRLWLAKKMGVGRKSVFRFALKIIALSILGVSKDRSVLTRAKSSRVASRKIRDRSIVLLRGLRRRLRFRSEDREAIDPAPGRRFDGEVGEICNDENGNVAD